jgi:purine nucleoside phosphorylase
LKLPFAAISLISNMASGMGQEKLDHSEIKEAASIRKQDLHRLIRAMIQKLDA